VKREPNLKLHVWEEIISLLKYEYNNSNDYRRKQDLTKEIVDAAEMIRKLKRDRSESKVS